MGDEADTEKQQGSGRDMTHRPLFLQTALKTEARDYVDITPREVALSRLVAAEMNVLPLVMDFRLQNMLIDHPVPWEFLENWLDAVDPHDGSGMVSLQVVDGLPMPEDITMAWLTGALAEDKGFYVTGAQLMQLPWRALVLPYIRPNGEPDERPIWKSPVLVRLLQVVSALTERTAWTEAQASTFVLVGSTPLIPQVTMEYLEDKDSPALSRVRMTVDPRLSPRDEVATYRQVRTKLVGTYHRDITPKHLELALFATLPDRSPGTLAQRMAEWNAAHPEWAYHSVPNFGRDMWLAARRLKGTSTKGRR